MYNFMDQINRCERNVCSVYLKVKYNAKKCNSPRLHYRNSTLVIPPAAVYEQHWCRSIFAINFYSCVFSFCNNTSAVGAASLQ